MEICPGKIAHSQVAGQPALGVGNLVWYDTPTSIQLGSPVPGGVRMVVCVPKNSFHTKPVRDFPPPLERMIRIVVGAALGLVPVGVAGSSGLL